MFELSYLQNRRLNLFHQSLNRQLSFLKKVFSG